MDKIEMTPMNEEIKTQEGVRLCVQKLVIDDQVEISLSAQNINNCLLHWGVIPHVQAPWQIPPRAVWPQGTKTFGKTAVQSPFLSQNGEKRISIRLHPPCDFSSIHFALYFPEEERWDNNNGQNYQIQLPNGAKPLPSPVQILQDEMAQKKIRFAHVYSLHKEGQLAVCVIDDENRYQVIFISNLPGPLLLHWGMARHNRTEWTMPPPSAWPANTVAFEKTAAQTPFMLHEGFNRLTMKFNKDNAPLGIPFVLKDLDSGIWFSNEGRNFYTPVRIPSSQEKLQASAKHLDLPQEIIHAEMKSDSWTLMHRFNLCYDLLDGIGDHPEEWIVIFVWLRFSAVRQLVWQKNYNTQPRELSYAMDRLTLKLADIYLRSDSSIREIIRLIFTTLGRGGEGQRIRDEFLNIMHRHKIKELAGTFMEEWHQKIHNNATPDDIVICEAYLQFLKKDGDLKIFYKSLEEGGVPRKRLEGFERSILSAPEFYPDIQNELIQDFEDYLKILRSVHSGVDLESAIQSAKGHLDKRTDGILQSLIRHRDHSKHSIVNLIAKVTDVRKHIKILLSQKADFEKARDLIFLDLALEGFLRIVLERHLLSQSDKMELVELMTLLLQNTILSDKGPEFETCLPHWERLLEMPEFHHDWALHAKSILDRVGRAIGILIDHYYTRIQPTAESLGNALHVDFWTIPLFTEEVIRGRSIFMLSLLLRYMDPVLRKAANLGNWQVISMGQGMGCVKLVEHLGFIQGKTFLRPTVVIADKINGDEEIPNGITAIITPDVTDIVSHIAVRARNKHLLFATCYDMEIISHLKSLKGEFIQLTATASGSMIVKRGVDSRVKIQTLKFNIPIAKKIRHDSGFHAITLNEFTDQRVGGKSHNLNRLQGKLPEWVHIPPSVALPFGVFDKLLNEAPNKEIKGLYLSLMSKIADHPQEMLAGLRDIIMDLAPSEGLLSSLRHAMQDAGLIWPEHWEKAWTCIKRVWASKWNERAYFSRVSAGIPHRDLVMAVLIQKVVEAQYAFVIHTTNPLTNDRDELYGELVPGLGETLVGNYPGRALSFISKKEVANPQILSYPSKSIALYGRGLIFRSDSSGEDLAGYAGAGLYDSVMFETPEEVLLDYTKEPIVWDHDFRKDVLTRITRIGMEVEKIFNGCPQDIEGVYSKGGYFIVQTRPQVGLKGYQS